MKLTQKKDLFTIIVIAFIYLYKEILKFESV